MINLTHNQEKLIKSLYTRHGRIKHNMSICEGVRSCEEVVKANPNLIHLAIKSDNTSLDEYLNSDNTIDSSNNLWRDIEFITIPHDKFKTLSSTIATQGVLFVINKPDTSSKIKPTDPFIIVLDGISDPGNMGTIIRSVKAIGLKDLWITAGSADPFSEKVIRSAMAAQFHLTIRLFNDLDEISCELRKLGYNNIFRTDCHKGVSIFEEDELFANSAIIFGNEGAGASELTSAKAITIPMPGKSESINVAQAATICLFEAVRRKILV